jgi:hypothetical protein
MNVASTNPVIKKKPGAGYGFGLEEKNYQWGRMRPHWSDGTYLCTTAAS